MVDELWKQEPKSKVKKRHQENHFNIVGFKTLKDVNLSFEPESRSAVWANLGICVTAFMN